MKMTSYILASHYFNEEYFDEMQSCIESPSNNIKGDKNIDKQYSFFVAGHTYGKPGSHKLGLYPQFYQEILNKTKQEKLELGFLTGDVVREASLKSWAAVNLQLSRLPFTVHIAPGNHDVGIGSDNAARDIYKMIYGETYYSFYKYNDLFIVLDPNISGWNIEKDQLKYLKNAIQDNFGRNNNIFIIMHQVIWNSNDDKYFKKIIYNSKAGKRNKVTNYWSQIAPLLEEQESNVYMISGDVGAFDNGSELFCGNVNNVKYIASGMGGGVRDNYLIFTVTGDAVSIEAVFFK